MKCGCTLHAEANRTQYARRVEPPPRMGYDVVTPRRLRMAFSVEAAPSSGRLLM
jgi:hypothetical protein